MKLRRVPTVDSYYSSFFVILSYRTYQVICEIIKLYGIL